MLNLASLLEDTSRRHARRDAVVLGDIRAAGAAVTGAELVAWAKERRAPDKYPRLVEVVESLPMTSTGKILKRELATSA